ALLADDHRVPGVVPALVPDDVVHAVAEQVGRLALALIAPLGANNHDGGHGFRLARPVPGEGSPGRLAGGCPGGGRGWAARGGWISAVRRAREWSRFRASRSADQACDRAAAAAGLASCRNSPVLAASSSSPIADAAALSR